MSDVSSPSNVSDLTLKVLENIRDDLRSLNGRVDGLRDDLGGVRADLNNLSTRVEAGFAALEHRMERVEIEAIGANRRLDSVLKIAGTHHSELEDRVSRIEQHLNLAGG